MPKAMTKEPVRVCNVLTRYYPKKVTDGFYG